MTYNPIEVIPWSPFFDRQFSSATCLTAGNGKTSKGSEFCKGILPKMAETRWTAIGWPLVILRFSGEWNPTQFYGDYFIGQFFWIALNQSVLNVARVGFTSFTMFNLIFCKKQIELFNGFIACMVLFHGWETDSPTLRKICLQIWQYFHKLFDLPVHGSYCWWKKSCTSW